MTANITPAFTYCGRCDKNTPTDADGKCPVCTKYKVDEGIPMTAITPESLLEVDATYPCREWLDECEREPLELCDADVRELVKVARIAIAQSNELARLKAPAEVAGLVEWLRVGRCRPYPDPTCGAACYCDMAEKVIAALESLSAQLAAANGREQGKQMVIGQLERQLAERDAKLGELATTIGKLNVERSERDAELASLKAPVDVAGVVSHLQEWPRITRKTAEEAAAALEAQAAQLSSAKARADELHENGIRLVEAADGWKTRSDAETLIRQRVEAQLAVCEKDRQRLIDSNEHWHIRVEQLLSDKQNLRDSLGSAEQQLAEAQRNAGAYRLDWMLAKDGRERAEQQLAERDAQLAALRKDFAVLTDFTQHLDDPQPEVIREVETWAQEVNREREEYAQLKASLAERDAELAALKGHAEAMHEQVRVMRLHFVSTLETARNIILFYGGECDPVEEMERNDPQLAAALKVMAAYRRDHPKE